MSQYMQLEEVKVIVNLQIISKVMRKFIDLILHKFYFDKREKNIMNFLIVIISSGNLFEYKISCLQLSNKY